VRAAAFVCVAVLGLLACRDEGPDTSEALCADLDGGASATGIYEDARDQYSEVEFSEVLNTATAEACPEHADDVSVMEFIETWSRDE